MAGPVYGAPDGRDDGRARPGAPRKVTDEQVEVLVNRTPTEKGRGQDTHWPTRTMAAETRLSQSSVSRIWRAFGLEAPRRGDLEAEHGPGVHREGPRRRRTHDYVRHGTTGPFAAYDLASGSVIAQHFRRHRHQEFLRFLKLIDASVSEDLDRRLVLHNYSAHKTPAISEWLLKHPRFRLIFAPAGSPQCQRAEAVIRKWINEWNKNPRPFVRTKSADIRSTRITRTHRAG